MSCPGNGKLREGIPPKRFIQPTGGWSNIGARNGLPSMETMALPRQVGIPRASVWPKPAAVISAVLPLKSLKPTSAAASKRAGCAPSPGLGPRKGPGHRGRGSHNPAPSSKIIYPKTMQRIGKAATPIYGWDCPLLLSKYPGFDCGSGVLLRTLARNCFASRL